MRIIKLNAIDSTNSFLKVLSTQEVVENFTVVSTDFQTDGKGQRGSGWQSENAKNLVFSVLYRQKLDNVSSLFTLNIVVALSIVEALQTVCDLDLVIKWPNDILAENKKIGGILIENTFKNSNEVQSVIGIGLNLNQSQFNNLPQASSLFLLAKKEFDRETLLIAIVNQFESNIKQLKVLGETHFWDTYHRILFKKEVVSSFEAISGKRFVGKIKEVTRDGKLAVLLEDDSVAFFDVKEVKMLY
ncbi:biotin--[acetyl-CoA-carboxylase] ligase [Flavobacterium sp. HXWNR69]|uniref:Biotin--[acetyl-CoA-carboxylase] ligase n=1 Tax=Flavobacterium fragile TaxID=2949085 RepID=A0ABT0TE74_9FLAO|nr:biotin--[acetyl-CoA-carboxylase] ligase [Flavobacterium sp. HXWNR69]MCL9769267.1 biotin--[acetyl-CoA-carboxylase] ligase [Flavobacterium sp. HXWNR69]